VTTYQIGDIVKVAGHWRPGRVEAVHKVAGHITGYRIGIPSTGQRLVVAPSEIEGVATLQDPEE
jgi:hypothetical protein